jgi:hypothetical protein
MHPHPMAPRLELHIIVVLGQVSPEPEDPMWWYNFHKAGNLGLVASEVAERHHERILAKTSIVHDCMVHVRCMLVGLLSG